MCDIENPIPEYNGRHEQLMDTGYPVRYLYKGNSLERGFDESSLRDCVYDLLKERKMCWQDFDMEILRLSCPKLMGTGYPVRYVWKGNSLERDYGDPPLSGMSTSVEKFIVKTVKQWGSLPVGGFDQSGITSKFSTWRNNGLLSMRTSDVLAMDKILANPSLSRVGSTAFRSLPQSGGQSFAASGSEDYKIQSHDSAASTGTLVLASPAFNNTPSVADQSVRASAPLEIRDSDGLPHSGGQSSTDSSSEDFVIQSHDLAAATGALELASPASASDRGYSATLGNSDNDGQPPPDRSPSDMELGEAPRRAEGRLQASSVGKVSASVASGMFIASSQIRTNSSTPLSANANTLLHCGEFWAFAGVILGFGAYFLQRKGKTAGVMAIMGCVATICSLLSILGTQFHENIMLWLTAALWVVPISASPFAMKELVGYTRHNA